MENEQINKRLKIISDITEEIRKIKSVYEESLENDPFYQEVQEKEKKLKEETQEKKAKVKAAPTIKNMDDEIKKLKNDLKEHKEALAQELADYYKESGSLQILDEDGNMKRIIFSVKLIKS